MNGEEAGKRCKAINVLLDKRPCGKLTCYIGVYTVQSDYHSTSAPFRPFEIIKWNNEKKFE